MNSSRLPTLERACEEQVGKIVVQVPHTIEWSEQPRASVGPH